MLSFLVSLFIALVYTYSRLFRPIGSKLCIFPLVRELRLKIPQFYELSKNAGDTFSGRLFVGLHHHFGMLWLLIGIIHTCKILDLSFVNKFVEAFHVALTANLDGALDVDFDKIPYLLACPVACLTIGSNSSRNADHAIACEQAGYKCNALNIGIPILAAKAQSLA